MAYSKTFKSKYTLDPVEVIHTIDGSEEHYVLKEEMPRVFREVFGEGWRIRVQEVIDSIYDPRNVTSPGDDETVDYYVTATAPDGETYKYKLSLVGKSMKLETDENDTDKIEKGIEKLIEEVNEFAASGASMEEVNAYLRRNVNGATEGGRRRKRRARNTRKVKGTRKSRKHMKKTHKRR